MDYCLGGDDGAAMWDPPMDTDLDGDGRLDAVRLDFDGDGLLDDAMADLDGDGHADHVVLNFADDTAASYFTDDGSGTWTVAVDRPGRLRWFGLDGVEHTGGPSVDVDGDGHVERLLDTDGDGTADRAVAAGRAYVDTDGDGRWDIQLIDDDGDGTADSVHALP